MYRTKTEFVSMHHDGEAATKLLVIDDDPLIHERVEICFSMDQMQISHALDVVEARDLLETQRPEIVLLDLRIPDTFGHDVCAEISKNYTAGIIVVTSTASRQERIRLLELGADDYIEKPFDDLELRARVKALQRRIQKSPADTASGSFSGGEFSFDARSLARVDGTTVTLTTGEAAVLSFMMKNPDTVLTRDEILAISRMRQHGGPTDRSVDNLVRRLRQKVEIDASNPKHVLTVWGRGYQFRP